MTFGDGGGFFKIVGAVGQAGADELVKAAIEGGINFFDMADVYTDGESEKTLGQSLKISPSRGKISSLPRRSMAAWARGVTMSALRVVT
jgi:aryl-alcohol dehydrogenase-like predicted oxidoreductase